MSSDLFPIKEYIYQDLKLELTSLCIYKLIYKDIEIGSIRQDILKLTCLINIKLYKN